MTRLLAAALALSLLSAGCASDDGAACPDCPTCPPVPPPPTAAKAPIDLEPLTTERRRTLTLLGFGAGDVVALDVKDDLAGSSYQIYDPAKQQVVKSYPYTAFTDKAQWRKAARVHEVEALGEASQRRPGGDLVLLGGDTPGWVVVYVMKGERAIPYVRVPRLSDPDGDPADVRVKRLAWTPDGKYAVVVHTQGLQDPRPWESDFLHVFALEAERLPFD
ncbi:MAG: hypothetical protein EP329_00885 [Deltaproteobacteria bacterium]|nr:MAG: hypothetical protein EP329_00885 [Deltaproteobacteria bacterium]